MIAASHATLGRPQVKPRPANDTPRRREQLRQRCMKELSRLDRLIIVLYYYEQLTAREVAAVLELPEEQIETRRAALAHRLGKVMAA